MGSKVHPVIHFSKGMRKPFIRKSITGCSEFHDTANVNDTVNSNIANKGNHGRSRENGLAGSQLALLATFQMLRTGFLGIPGLARYMQICRRTRDNPHADLLWRLFVRARYPLHPFEQNDRVPRGLFSSIDPNSIRIAKVEHRTFPCSTQLNTCSLRDRNDFKIVCTREQSIAILRGALKNNAAFTGGLLPRLFMAANRKQKRYRRKSNQRKQRQKSCLNNIVVIDLCRPYVVQAVTAQGCNAPDSLHSERTPSEDQPEIDHSFWSGRTETFENPTDYRTWWSRLQVCIS